MHYHPDKNPTATEDEKKEMQNKFMGIHSAFCLIREYRKESGKPIPKSDILSKTSLSVENDKSDD